MPATAPGSGGAPAVARVAGTGPARGRERRRGWRRRRTIRPPELRGLALPFGKPPKELRGKTITVLFSITTDGRVDHFETQPEITDRGFYKKFSEVVMGYRFKPARGPDGQPVAVVFPISSTSRPANDAGLTLLEAPCPDSSSGSPSPIAKTTSPSAGGLKRSLGKWHLTALGVGATIGAGIFATTGTAIVGDPLRPGAGPAIIFSFLLTALTCGFAALCYAEFAAMVPISGSAYTYAYASLGELVAWIIGWDLIIEYAVGNIGVAIGWAGYFRELLSHFGLALPAWLATDYRSAHMAARGGRRRARPTPANLYLASAIADRAAPLRPARHRQPARRS